MKELLGAGELDQLFRAARTHNQWEDRPVSDELLRELYGLAKMGPTSMNCCPMRLVFVKSPAAKARLKPCLAPGNVEKTMRAPVTAIIASDSRFFEHLPQLFPHYPAGRAMFEDDPDLAASTAFRNATLQGGYLILAARALGLDVGPMSGFDAAKLEQAFFPDGRLRANFLANLGYGDPCGLYPRGPRLDFDVAARIL